MNGLGSSCAALESRGILEYTWAQPGKHSHVCILFGPNLRVTVSSGVQKAGNHF